MPTIKQKIGNLGGDYGMDLNVDAGLENMHLSFDKLPDIVSRVKELPRIELGDINTNIHVKEMPRIEIDANTKSSLDIAIKEIPEVRAHLPAHYNLGISIFGVEIINFSLCGESQVITEKYIPRRMELCR
jgi:hypothetical protein